MTAAQNGYHSSVDTSLNMSSDGTGNEMQVTSQKAVEERYTEMGHSDLTLDGYSTEMQVNSESQDAVENDKTDNTAEVAGNIKILMRE